MAASQLPRDPLQTPPARPQAQHLRHVVWRLHHLPPWIFPRRTFRDSLLVHALSPQLAKEGQFLVAPRGQFSMARDTAEGLSLTIASTAAGCPRSGGRPR